jgi:hypothetical protein
MSKATLVPIGALCGGIVDVVGFWSKFRDCLLKEDGVIVVELIGMREVIVSTECGLMLETSSPKSLQKYLDLIIALQAPA